MTISTALDVLPQCPQGHGQMVLRDPPGGHTPEQRWCGTWYDCPPGQFHCRSSVLLPSPDLRAPYAAAGLISPAGPRHDTPVALPTGRLGLTA